MIGHAAQFAVNSHRRTANKLKLTDTPARRPGSSSGGRFFHRLAAFVVQLVVQGVPVDIFGNVFGHITGGGAFFRVDGFRMETGFAGFGGNKLHAILLKGVIPQDLPHLVGLVRAHEKQHVPVGGAIVVRFGYTDAENTQIFAVQLGARFLPHAAQIALGVRRAAAVPLAVAVSVDRGGVEF